MDGSAMTREERTRLIACGAMDDEQDSYPRICEFCSAEFHGNFDAAEAAGWRCGWDGWVCDKCDDHENGEEE